MVSRQRRSLRLEKGPWRLEAKTTAGILVILTLLGLLSWLCLVQASKVSTAEYRIREKEVEMERLQRENAELLADVVDMLSVARLEHKALELGYVLPADRRYLDVPGYSGSVLGERLTAAPRVDGTAAIAPQEPNGETRDAARWWEKVIAQFVAWAETQP